MQSDICEVSNNRLELMYNMNSFDLNNSLSLSLSLSPLSFHPSKLSFHSLLDECVSLVPEISFKIKTKIIRILC